MIPRDLFSAFITSISIFSAELNQELGYSKKYGRLSSIPLNIFFEIMISYKDPLIGALIIEKKHIDEDVKHFIDDTLNEFLIIYENVLKGWNNKITDIIQFELFENEIKRIYEKAEILSYQIPNLQEGYENKSFLSEIYVHIINEIDGQRNIKKISQKLGKSVDEVKIMISNLLWLEVITLSEKVYDDDIFEPKKDLFYLIRTKDMISEKDISEYTERKLIEYQILEAIDGFKSISDLLEDFKNIPIHEIKHIISKYLLKGSYLEKIELFPQIIKIDEETLEEMSTEKLGLAYSLENICDGELSLLDISEKVGVPIKEIKKTLDLLGKHVIYKKKYIK